ncbi:MAG TPA: retroviral-like aspartic protease family protein [Steroidobacteraceae bacterium]|jgi:predicted aspartyl protease|nr:retroviral-like aspartic protease family protein [Steroidobacteraceae bacterium]
MFVALTYCFQIALLAAEGATPPVVTPPAPSPAAVSPAIATPEPIFATPTRLDRIGRVVAPVTINGKGPFRLVVDTGASHSTFSPQLVTMLGLSPSFDEPLMLNGVTGVAQVPTVAVERIQAGDMTIEHAQVPVVLSSIMTGADGILGVAGLRNQRILVDFRHDRVVITRATHRIDTGGYLRIGARKVAGGLLMVDARVGGVRARAVIDTGAERTLGNAALRDALLKRQGGGPGSHWANTEVYGATTDVANGESAIAPPIKLGSAVIKGTEVVYGDFHIFKVWDLDSRPAALIGMDVLGTVGAIVLDYSSRDVYLDVRPVERGRVAESAATAAGKTHVASSSACASGATRIPRANTCP